MSERNVTGNVVIPKPIVHIAIEAIEIHVPMYLHRDHGLEDGAAIELELDDVSFAPARRFTGRIARVTNDSSFNLGAQPHTLVVHQLRFAP